MVSRPLGLLLLLVLVVPAWMPTVGAQLPATPLDPILDPAGSNGTRATETALGPALTREDVDIALRMVFRTVDFDTVNVIFGGGKFQAVARIEARIDMRVIAASRVKEGAEGAFPPAGNLSAIGVGADDQYIPADAFRATFAGEVLRAFQDEQEARLADYIRATVPNVTVMATTFAWSNVSPQDSIEEKEPVPGQVPSAASFNDPTYPPLTLRATVDIEYLERTNLLAILEKALRPTSEDEKARKARVADAGAAYERGAFGLMGIRQVLDLAAPEGWNLEVRVELPDGYTFEEASPDVSVARDLRRADVVTLGKDANGEVLNPVALTLSNRFLVSTALLGVILLVGTILRFPVLLIAHRVRRLLREPVEEDRFRAR